MKLYLQSILLINSIHRLRTRSIFVAYLRAVAFIYERSNHMITSKNCYNTAKYLLYHCYLIFIYILLLIFREFVSLSVTANVVTYFLVSVDWSSLPSRERFCRQLKPVTHAMTRIGFKVEYITRVKLNSWIICVNAWIVVIPCWRV